ncbi:MAG: hypothetical protein NZL87_07180 [Thermomicrobium sp.]|nr:hypothetical protein [Thermomicrobium sp.]
MIESYTTTFADAALGVDRLRLANQGAMRCNIETSIDPLVAHDAR